MLICLGSCGKKNKSIDPNTNNKIIKKNSTDSGIQLSNFEASIDGINTSLFVLKNKNGIEATFSNYGQRLVTLLTPDRNGKMEEGEDHLIGKPDVEILIKSVEGLARHIDS